MIDRTEKITEKAILIGFIISMIVWALSVRTSPANVQIGNIGLPQNVINELRKLLNP